MWVMSESSPAGQARARPKPTKSARAARKPSANKKPGANKKLRAKTATRSTRRRVKRAAAASPMLAAPILAAPVIAAPVVADDAELPRPSALSRLKTGVGSLFARMTGRAAKPGDEPGAVAPNDRTMELAPEDILESDDE